MVITILTGRRPKLLNKTIGSLQEKVPGLLDSNYVIMFNNACDKKTVDLIEKFDFVDKLIERKRTVSIGRAMSMLAKEVKKTDEYIWFHLEDDWECMNGGWLDKATELILNPEISQVRLRLDNEPALRTHMITGEPIRWQYKLGHKIANKAHFTQNPNLIRVEDVDNIFPATGERVAQKNWMNNGMKKVAQMIPGSFKHIGDKDSLRAKTLCEV